MRNGARLFTIVVSVGACYGPQVPPGETPDAGPDDCGDMYQPCCTGTCDEGLACAAGQCGCFAAVAMAERHACAIRADGQVWCWGEDTAGKLGYEASQTCAGLSNGLCSPTPMAAPPLEGASLLGLGAGLTCLMRDGQLWCVGGDSFPEPALGRIGVFTRVTAVGAGWRFACFVDEGQAYCLGHNQSHILGVTGLSHDEFSQMPLPISGATDATELVVGGRSACVLTMGGRVLCWGGNHYRQLGSNNAVEACTDEILDPHPCSSVPLDVPLPTAATHLVAGAYFVCAQLVNGETWCWGDNRSGQILGAKGGFSLSTRIDPYFSYPAEALFAGGNVACIRVTPPAGPPEIACWGDNSYGLFGNATMQLSAPLQATGFSGALQVAPGTTSMCGLYPNKIVCSGDDAYGQLGIGGFTNTLVAVTNLVSCP